MVQRFFYQDLMEIGKVDGEPGGRGGCRLSSLLHSSNIYQKLLCDRQKMVSKSRHSIHALTKEVSRKREKGMGPCPCVPGIPAWTWWLRRTSRWNHKIWGTKPNWGGRRADRASVREKGQQTQGPWDRRARESHTELEAGQWAEVKWGMGRFPAMWGPLDDSMGPSLYPKKNVKLL